MYGFKGKKTFVTGAAMGIGQEVALRLASEGSDLALVDINLEGLAETARQAAALGVEVVTIKTDVASSVSVKAAVDRALAKFGHIDFLVNVAGVGILNEFMDVPESDWDRTIDINVKGTFLTCQMLGKHMMERRQGRIVNMASIAGKTGGETAIPYCASKGAVVVLTQSVSRALAPYGINVNAVCPGLVWTPMWRVTATWTGEHSPAFRDQGLTPEQVYEASVKAGTPLGLPTTKADIAAAVAFLLSDEAKIITGQSINVDGGIEMH
jgi:NAD(P)-dependent dehydrogenase (short-subunit alcohol dehydrogenase family)